MSDYFNVVKRWTDLGQNWKHIYQSIDAKLPIPAGVAVPLPGQIAQLKYPQAVLIFGQLIFDHPLCGVEFMSDPLIDTQQSLTVQRMLLSGATLPTNIFHARAPPDTPPGLFMIDIHGLYWESNAKFNAINTDPANAHDLIFGVFDVAALLDQPLIQSKENLQVKPSLEMHVKCPGGSI